MRSCTQHENSSPRCCLEYSPQAEYIQSKIFEANTLIDRVKDTLSDIKNNTKLKTGNEISRQTSKDEAVATEETFVSQIVYDDIFAKSISQNDDSTNNLSRPKTRRNDEGTREENSRLEELQEKMKNSDEPDGVEEISSIEGLQAKLNTIEEQTESDLTSSSSDTKTTKEEEKVTTATIYCNTEVIIQQSEETQVQPEVKASGTQISLNNFDNSTQTDKEKSLSEESTTTVEITNPELMTIKHLTVQVLPSIDITRGLTVQKIHHFAIDKDGKTHFFSPMKDANVAYYEITADNGDMLNAKPSLFDVKQTVRMLHFRERNTLIPSEINCLAVYSDTLSVSDTALLHKNKSENPEDSEADSTVVSSNKIPNKELVYKSYQLYDNPNMHDPGELSNDLDVSSIDTSFYKTFINPKGLPSASATSDLERKRLTLKGKISFISNPPTQRKSEAAHLELQIKSQKSRSPTVPKELNSKLWDIGLYCSKAVQCCTTPPTRIEEIKQQGTNDNSAKADSNSSYEKISFSISYSTEESVTTDSSDDKDNKQIKTENEKVSPAVESSPRSTMENVQNLLEVDETQFSSSSTPVEIKDVKTGQSILSTPKYSKTVRGRDDKKIKATPTRETDAFHSDMKHVRTELSTTLAASKSSKGFKWKGNVGTKTMSTHNTESLHTEVKRDKTDQSTSSTIAKNSKVFKGRDETQIKALSERGIESIQSEIKHVKRDHSALSTESEKHACDMESFRSTDSAVHEFISGLTETTSDDIKKVIPKIRKPKDKGSSQNFTVLPVQIHGDYRPSSYIKRPHLKLCSKSKYKDEDLFCGSNCPMFENIPLRYRALKSIPKCHFKKYTLDSSNSDTITREETVSEGEVNCRCSTSIGEVHKCKSMDPFERKQSRLIYRKCNEDSNITVREKRTYFNHWITYYINKVIPPVNDSSSSSNSK